MKKQLFIDLSTGEVIKKRTLWGACRYFRKSAKKYNTFYSKGLIMNYQEYKDLDKKLKLIEVDNGEDTYYCFTVND